MSQETEWGKAETNIRPDAGGNQNKKEGTIVLLVLLLIVLGFVAGGAGMLYNAYLHTQRCSITTEGVIIDYERELMSGSHKRGWRPVVEYRVGGEVLTVTHSVTESPKPFKTGTQVTVAYNPEDPTDFYIRGHHLKTQCKIGIMLILVGLCFTIGIVFSTLSGKMEEEKRKRLQEKVFPLIGGFVVLSGFVLLAGWKLTLAGAIFFGFWMKYDKSRKKKQKTDENKQIEK